MHSYSYKEKKNQLVSSFILPVIKPVLGPIDTRLLHPSFVNTVV